jgi:trehalose-phosphatase
MKPALSDPALRRRIEASRPGRRIFLSDFDGTLAPIVPDFLRAKAGKGVEALIAELRARGWRIVLLTGRGLGDLRRRIRTKGIVCGGNHGWEWTGGMARAAGQPSAAAKRAVRRSIRAAAQVLRAYMEGIPGVQVEEKLYFAGVHHRLVPASRRAEFERAFGRARKDPRLSGFRWRSGKKIEELLSPVRWGKGEGTRLLIRHYRPDLVVAAGDDTTDEEMFKAVGKNGVSVRVGRTARTFARHYVERQTDMVRLMRLLVSCGGKRSARV